MPAPRSSTPPWTRSTRTATWSGTSRSGSATPTRPPPTWWWSASTRSACRTRPSSAPSPAWPCRPPTAGSTCTSPPSGCTSTRAQIAPCLGLPEEKVRLTLAGVGGAFGAREDLSMQVHACLLALHTGKPVRMVVQPGGVVLRPRAPAPGLDAVRARGRPRRPAGLRQGDDRARRRRLRLDHARPSWATRPRSASGPYEVPARRDRRLRRAYQQPALRRHARLRRGAGLLRVRVADGRAGGRSSGWTRSRSGSATRCRRARCCRPAR